MTNSWNWLTAWLTGDMAQLSILWVLAMPVIILVDAIVRNSRKRKQ